MTLPTSVPTATLLVGYTHQSERALVHFHQLADQVATQLNQPVIPCSLDGTGNPVLDGIREGLRQGAVKFVVLPLFLSPAEYRDSLIADAITWASRRWSFLSFHVSPLLGCSQWGHVIASLMAEAEAAQTGVVLIASKADGDSPSTEPPSTEVIGDLAKLARQLQETRALSRVELTAGSTILDIQAAARHCLLAGAEQIVAIPTFLFEDGAYAQLKAAIQQIRERLACSIWLTSPISEATSLVDHLVGLHKDSLTDDSLLPISWEEVRRQVEASNADHRSVSFGVDELPEDERQFQDLTQRINAILPPRYQQSDGVAPTVSAAPMASADLQFDGDGKVAWDQMWGFDDPDSPFCELALAGGPPHRGDLLEPVAAPKCEAEPGKYAAVLAELTRGIELVAGLPTVHSAVLGWVGIRCASEEMAIWLLRAIIVENVMVRREADVLYLPAGPGFELSAEIKNVVTVIAKTVHYWTEHQLAMSMAGSVDKESVYKAPLEKRPRKIEN